MFEVVKNKVQPPRARKDGPSKYPALEIGDGFIVHPHQFDGNKNPAEAIRQTYRAQRQQRVSIIKDADGNLHVKRIA